MTSSSLVQRSVLIVEDETLLRMIAIDIFEDAGFNVLAAETADEAALILEDAQRIDGVFTDIETPGTLNGLAIAKITRDRHPDAAILIVSGRTFPQQAQLPPGSRFMGKPYRTAAVVRALQDMWER
jgi:CheY-like chemotaxis protein